MKTNDNGEFTVETAVGRFATFFDEQEWKYRRDEESPILYLGFSGDGCKLDCKALVEARKDDQYWLCFLCTLPVKAPAAKRAACAELLNRINYGLLIGSFEMDFQNGVIGFRTSAMLPAEDVSLGAIRHLTMGNLCQVDDYYAPIMAVLYSETTPEQALKPKDQKTTPVSGSRFEIN